MSMRVAQLREALEGMPDDGEVIIMVTDEGVYDGPETKVTIQYWYSTDTVSHAVYFSGKANRW